ncbi:hypothetical protein EDF58_10191 [Novosphingobium sp. PhB57]|uniref:DUF4350 domain-containing protein n=1 Tax=Novosphingobium sp. PhB57 TaxID=2485107 RepID=UPI0010DE61B9|nr:DUF4350 domain-containing protein [Novosphingobium sp. PhB57]TCU60796.1 hypothetical protein EDF58_10191 [Novosphingobium sp. PhB57]
MLAATLTSCGDSAAPRRDRAIGLYTSLPIVWGESGDVRELLAPERARHWALAPLDEAGRLTPLDTLAGPNGRLPLPSGALLVLAQPRPLSPQENVALDRWVREGGHLLLFADPMLTMPSRHALGDPRRPQDMVLLSPILAHWGLALEFDAGQRAGERLVQTSAGPLPVDLAGRFRASGNSGEGPSSSGISGKAGSDGDGAVSAGKSGTGGKSGDETASCLYEADGVLARCRLGKGRILAISDAALLEDPEEVPSLDLRRKTFARLIEQAKSGD